MPSESVRALEPTGAGWRYAGTDEALTLLRVVNSEDFRFLQHLGVVWIARKAKQALAISSCTEQRGCIKFDSRQRKQTGGLRYNSVSRGWVMHRRTRIQVRRHLPPRMRG